MYYKKTRITNTPLVLHGIKPRKKKSPKWKRGLCQEHGCKKKVINYKPFCSVHLAKRLGMSIRFRTFDKKWWTDNPTNNPKLDEHKSTSVHKLDKYFKKPEERLIEHLIIRSKFEPKIILRKKNVKICD